MIIIEGVDGSGKTQLANHLAKKFQRGVHRSEGPEKYYGEVNFRTHRYRTFSYDMIYDRHPAISHNIYRKLSGGCVLTEAHVRWFLRRPKLVIFCQPEVPDFQRDKQTSTFDTPSFVDKVEADFHKLQRAYRDYFLYQPADVIYDWNNLREVETEVQVYLNKTFFLNAGYVSHLRDPITDLYEVVAPRGILQSWGIEPGLPTSEVHFSVEANRQTYEAARAFDQLLDARQPLRGHQWYLGSEYFRGKVPFLRPIVEKAKGLQK